MTQPAVTINELDGALGVLPAGFGKLFALVGVSSAGLTDTPATYARTSDVIAAFERGPLVEAACHYIERYRRPVVLVRTGQSVLGDEGTLVLTDWTGTSVPTLNTVEPDDDFELLLEIVTGGTIATAGITYRYSLDGGRTVSPIQDLGTAATITFPDTGGVSIDFGVGTIVAGDTLTTRTTAPNWNATELGTALDALKNTAAAWEICHIVGPIDATAFDAIELKFASMLAAGKPRAWVGNTRIPDIAETEATYLTALTTIFASKAAAFGGLCAGACKLTSSVSGRKYKRPIAFAYAAREASVSEEVDVADVNLGALVGVSIRDANGNADEHDESLNPGLDDARFVALRTWEGIQGVYVNRPLLFSAAGSDFELLPHRRVMNVAHDVLRPYFQRRLNKPVLVDKTTGYILESDAAEIEAGARAVLESALLAKPKASAIEFTLSRTDNLLSTKTLKGQARITPLAYPESIDLDLGFSNPSLQVQAV